MTTAQELGTIEKVNIREVWPTEDDHFTPWLGENLDKLGAELGLDLELAETEATVGTFRLDVRARDVGSQGEVVIENQFGQTDHSHLGQLLTYASGFDASALVWIAENFRDEHREALDFLNHRTGEDTRFFGVEIELWRIGDSLPAVNFNLVAAPNEWHKANTPRKSTQSPTQNANRLFHDQLHKVLSPDKKRRDRRSAWRVLEFPTPYVRYAVFWHSGTPGFELIIYGKNRDWNLRIFQDLEKDKGDIETRLTDSEAHEWFSWEELWQSKNSRIAIYRNGDVYQEQEKWDEYQEWMLRKYANFKEVFGPRLAELGGLTDK